MGGDADGVMAGAGGGVGGEGVVEGLKKWKSRREFLHLGELDFEVGRERKQGSMEGEVEREVKTDGVDEGFRDGNVEEKVERAKDEDILVDIDDGDEETKATGN